MLIRFVTPGIDAFPRQPRGIFHSAYDLLRSEAVEESFRDVLRDSLDWFEANLPVPPSDRFKSGQAICWFKPSARECVRRLWPVAWMLREEGIDVRLVTTHRPGRMRYQDEFQVVAIPAGRR